MARRAIDIGPTGQVFAANLTRFRGLRGLRLAGLSERMSEAGRPMSISTISAIENLDRRADIDDLVAFAAALGVSPAAMLMDPQTDSYGPVAATVNINGVDEAGPLWRWLTATAPLDAPYERSKQDEISIEAWRREQVPPWDHRRGTVNHVQ